MKVTYRKHRSARWLFVVFSLSAAVPAWGAAPQSAWPQTEQDFRQLVGGGTQLLVFRDAQGRSISRVQFVSLLKNDKGAKLDIGYDEDSAFFTIVKTPLKKPAAGMKSALRHGDLIPNFVLMSLDGQRFSNENFHTNKLTLVNFFFVGCTGCIAEIPVMNAFKTKHPDLPTVAFTYDPAVAAQAFVRRWKLHWQIVPNAVKFTTQVGIWEYPMFALVDDKGRLISMTGSWDMHAPGTKLTADDIARWVKTVSACHETS